jgi:hypothetical protein
MPDPQNPLRVLVAEGSFCDPSPWCLSRFSQLIRKFHRCPGLRDDPAGYLAFIEQRLTEEKFDVLLPTHQQGFLFARAKPRIEGRAGFALPGFANYRAHSKAGFSPAALKHQRYNGSSSLPSRSRFGVAMSPSSLSSSSTGIRSGFFGLSSAGFGGSFFLPVPPM